MAAWRSFFKWLISVFALWTNVWRCWISSWGGLVFSLLDEEVEDAVVLKVLFIDWSTSVSFVAVVAVAERVVQLMNYYDPVRLLKLKLQKPNTLVPLRTGRLHCAQTARQCHTMSCGQQRGHTAPLRCNRICENARAFRHTRWVDGNRKWGAMKQLLDQSWA